MAKHVGETDHGSYTAFIRQMPDTGGVAVEAKMEREFDPASDAWLDDLRVLPEGQGKGEGKALLLDLEVKARGCRRIIGSFEPSNFSAALRLYSDQGYRLQQSKRDPSIMYIIKDLASE